MKFFLPHCAYNKKAKALYSNVYHFPLGSIIARRYKKGYNRPSILNIFFIHNIS